MAELKNIRLAVSGIYDYALEELPTLRIPMPGHGAPDWVEEKRLYQVYRPPFVLAAACDKFKMLPLTHHHPRVPVDGQNFRDLALGYTGENPTVDYVKEKNEVGIRSTLMMYDDEALQAYENGEIQLSPGYVAVFEWQKGTSPDGQPYDIVMKEITDVNHVALLPKGRGGEYAVVMDKAAKVSNVFDIAKARREVLDYGTVFDIARSLTEDVTFEEGHVSHRKDGDYVKQGGTWKPVKNETSEKKELKIKQGLKKTEDIADYFESTLSKYGIEVERKHSGLSGSEYIIIKGEGEKFGKADTDEVEIRISDHNLPPSYDRQYAGDFDVRSEGIERGGANGEANDYEDVLLIVCEKLGIDTSGEREKRQKLYKEKQERERESHERYQKELKEKNATAQSLYDNLKNSNPQDYEKVKAIEKKLNEKSDTPDYFGVYPNKYTGKERKRLNEERKEILKRNGIKFETF